MILKQCHLFFRKIRSFDVSAHLLTCIALVSEFANWRGVVQEAGEESIPGNDSTRNTQEFCKVDVCYLDAFLSAPTSRRIWNTQFVRDNSESVEMVPVAICPIIYQSSYEYLFHYQSQVSRAHSVVISYRSSQSCSLLSLEWLAYFEHAVQSL